MDIKYVKEYNTDDEIKKTVDKLIILNKLIKKTKHNVLNGVKEELKDIDSIYKEAKKLLGELNEQGSD